MSEREKVIQLLDRIPEGKMYYVIKFLEEVVIPDESPNEETLVSFQEGDKMLKNGIGQKFSNLTEFWESLENSKL